jgi:hypothetical protein
MLPAASVLFELGRETSSVAAHGLRAFRIADILRHARLQSPDQVVECLDVLTEALERLRGDPTTAFYALDDQGHCLVAEATMRSILRLWQEIVAQRSEASEPVAEGLPNGRLRPEADLAVGPAANDRKR